MTEKIYLETFEKCPGSFYSPLLMVPLDKRLQWGNLKQQPLRQI